MVLAAAKKLKCEKVDVGFSFSDSSEVLPMDLYMAVGGRFFSYFRKPFISFHLTAAQEAKNLQDCVEPFSTSAKKFISAHEVSHIVFNHTLAQSIATLVYGLFNTILWQQRWSEDYSQRDTFGIALIAAFVYQIFFSALVRHHEKQADLLACDALESNKEALEFFQAIAELRKGKPEAVDVSHPPISERIAYVKASKNKAEAGHMKLS